MATDWNPYRRLRLAGRVTFLAALVPPPGAFAGLCSRDPEPDVVDVDPFNTGIVFSPVEVFEAMVLSVTGPFGYTSVQEVGPDQDAVFELDPPNTVDGCYSWEVRIDPILDGEILEALASARESGDDSQVRALMREGSLPDRARVQSGAFQVVQGRIILGGPPEQGQARVAPDVEGPICTAAIPHKDYVINDDLIVDGSTCVGHDCFNGWTFDFTTFAVSENNTRIKFDDTSYLASYPNNDWQLVANDASRGGIERFSILDCGDNDAQGYCSGGQVFTIEAGAPGAAFYVDDQGRVGFGTPTPYYELHVVDGDTPTLRLAQDGSLGFTPQSFDIAGNEQSFFIRDATSGSKIPLRIKTGAPTNSLTIQDTGYVGLGTWSPGDRLHVEAGGSENPGIRIVNTDVDSQGWAFRVVDVDEFRISKQSVAGSEFQLDASGNLTISGDITSGGTTYVPDYVFEPDYPLLPLAELAAFIARQKHLPGIPSAAQVGERGSVNISRMQMRLLEKIEELTLYTLDQQETIATQQETIAAQQEALLGQQEAIRGLQARLSALEGRPGSDP